METLAKQGEIADIVFSGGSLDELLVDLHDAQARYTYASGNKEGKRLGIVQTVAQIVRAPNTDAERAMVTDILVSLVRQAEIDLRESLAERLCGMAELPEDVALQLAHDVISVADPMLRYSPVLTPQDLLYIIQSKGAEYWRAIATRKLLQTAVVDALVERNDDGTALNLLLNESIDLKEKALEAFAELSKYSDQLAEPLLRRTELPESVAMSVYWHVGAQLREQIARKFSVAKEKIDAALNDALEDFADTAAGGQDPRPSALMVDMARQYARGDRISDVMLIKTLRRGQARFFVALLAERTGLNHQTVIEIMRQVGGQGMAVACRACGVVKENFVSIFLLARSLGRGNQAVDAMELRKAIKYYDAMTEDMAATILANSIIGKTA